MWTIGDVLYATFHIVGTNNARDKVNQDSVESAIKSVRKREVSLKKWFDYTAYRASLLEPKAIVIGFHADPWNPKQLRDYKGACRDGNRQKCDGLTFFRDLLREFLRKVKIPVLAVHGDSKGYCFNHPMDEMNEPNFWRINGPGDNRIFDALVVRVNPGAEQPFRPRGLLSSKALPLTEDCPVPDQPKEPE